MNASQQITELQTRNAALEAKVRRIEAELRKREAQLVEAGKDAAVRNRECEALREANAELLNEVQELRQRDKARDEEVERLRTGAGTTADKWLDRYVDKCDVLEADNTRLRRALLEQAAVFATTLKAILPA